MFGTNNLLKVGCMQTIELKKNTHKSMQQNLDYNKDLLFSKNNSNYDEITFVIIMYFNILCKNIMSKKAYSPRFSNEIEG